MAPGWYNDMAKSQFLNANLDNKQATHGLDRY